MADNSDLMALLDGPAEPVVTPGQRRIDYALTVVAAAAQLYERAATLERMDSYEMTDSERQAYNCILKGIRDNVAAALKRLPDA